MEDDEETFGATMRIASETAEAEKEYEKVLEQLREAEGLKLYADVYTKLYDSYFKLKEENGVHLEEISSLKNRLKRFDDTVSEYLKEISEANKTIETLRADIEEARALADAMHARELATVESLETMKKTVARLEKELDARKRAGDDDAGATSAVKEKEKFEKEKARLQGELDGIKLRLTNSLNYIEELEQKMNTAEDNIAKLEESLEEADNNAVRQNRLVDHLKGESATLKLEVETRGNTIGGLNDKLSKAEKTIDRRDRQLRDMGNKLDTARQEQEAALTKAATLRDQLDNTNAQFDKTKQALTNTSRELRNMTDEGTRLRNELTKMRKDAVQQTKRYQLLEKNKAAVESDRDRLRQQVSVMEREIMLSKKAAEADRRDIENLNREKDILNKTLQKIQNEALENLHMLNLQEQRRKQLEHELEMNAAQITKQRLLIRQLEKDKDRMLEETIALNEKIDEITEEVRLRNADILDLNKALRDETIKVRKLSVALDATRAERNMLHKNYTESLDEIQDLKQKLKMLAYQIEQLKEDISGKESGLKTCEGVLSKCHKKVEMLRSEVQAGLVKLSDARADIAALRQEEARLNRIVQEGDTARAKLMKELEGLMNERDVVGAQLVRRNDEISLLYEKIRILEITLHRGERQYEQRVEDIRLLRLEIIRLRKEKNLLSKGIENMTDLRLEVFNLERELGRERLRVRALEEALETPLNVHRWRKLQGTDPESVQLTQKLRVTQKKVLAQSEMLVLKDRELKETRNLYNAVKDMLALQPSPEIQQTLTRTQRALAQRTSKMKCLIAELSMREKQVADLRLELDRANGDLHSFKQRYYEMKRALDADEARRLRVPSPQSQTAAM
ncbi:cilia- and flagella-associated protein 58-like isoform X1 [Plodia interpunctella]|uniref:cilia- and flagella-associated protein 58-like isoform X1 n=2 Tax=Plodia interpunctella TaxID=58824 RepID=UPI002367F571|nr:cilia- and flagella-associated protein 58-like isoform X1 [Plodia interpunctella]